MTFRPFALTLLLMSFIVGCITPSPVPDDGIVPYTPEERVPEWAKDAVWYQIFPERFRDGDPSNNPTRESLEFPVDERIPENWAITPWTGDWYARADWETARGDDFYEDGVFDRRLGGDLQGIIDQMDYIRDLGINAIYFNPVFFARSLHKYDGNSFHHVDPHFGPDPEGDFALMETETSVPSTWNWTSADLLFLDLLDAAHARNIRVIIDGVFNHTGREFFAFKDLMENQQNSPYKDWYVVEEFEDPDVPGSTFRYAGWWGVHTLPEFAEVENDLHAGPKEYIFDATRRWMAPVVDGVQRHGIDGWRLDVANEVPVGFWRDWHALVKELNPEAYTVAEIWDDGEAFLSGAGFSATMNYHAFSYPVKGFLIDRNIGAAEFAEMIEERAEAYPEPVRYGMQNLIDSHDTDRVASMVVNAKDPSEYEQAYRFDYDVNVSPRSYPSYDVRKPNAEEWELVRLISLFQATYVGAPMYYYGTEAGMWGADDPDDRKPMIWPDLTYEDEQHDPLGRERTPDVVAFDHDMFRFHRDIIEIRHDSQALRRGTYETVHADVAFAFAREYDDERLVIVLNASDETASVELSDRVISTVFSTHTDYEISLEGTVILAPRSGIILRVSAD